MRIKWRPFCNADMGGDGSGEPVPGSLLGAEDTPGTGEGGEPNTQVPQEGQAGTEQAVETAFQPFTLPEGITYDAEQAREFEGAAKELGLNQEQAQKLVDLYAKKWLGGVDEFEKDLIAERAKWEGECKNHPEFGGAKFDESLGHARKFIDAFGGDELRMAMRKVGDHPALFAAFAKAGKLLAEDGFVPGSSRGADRTFSGMAKAMYPDMN